MYLGKDKKGSKEIKNPSLMSLKDKRTAKKARKALKRYF